MADQQIMTIRIGSYAPVTLAANNVSLSEKLVVQKATGVAFEQFLANENQIGELSLSVLWWLARRSNGEPMLTWTQVQKDWPTPFTEDDVDVDVAEPSTEAADPEA